MAIDWRKAMAPALVLGALTFLIHLFANGGYGIFRDELYFIVCGQRPAWGYVDQPPLVPLIAAWSYALAGDWLTGFRLIPALVMAVTVGATAEFTRQLGGGRFSQALAGLCVLGAPIYLVFGMFVSTDMFQPLTWLAAAWCLVKLAKTRDENWWIAFGLVVAFSLWSKYAIVFFVAALAVGAVFTPLRASLAKPWVYAAAALVAVLVLPNIFWQQAHGWPFLELGAAGVHGKNRALSLVPFFAQELLLTGPLAALVWAAGLWKLAVRPDHKAFRVFPIAFVVLTAFFIAAHGKATYLVPVFPLFLAAGAVFWEAKLTSVAGRSAVLAVFAIGAAVFLPMSLPVLPEETYIRYAAALGFGPSATAGENYRLGRLPQHFADMHGWKQFAAKIAAVYHALPPQDRQKAVFIGGNYGEAAAVDVFGARLGLPPAISGHNNYWIWGPRGASGDVVIVVGGKPQDYADYASVRLAGRLDSPYAVPYEADRPIYVLRGRSTRLDTDWARFKHYD